MIDLSGLIAISGYPGLYKVVAQAKNGVIVESLLDGKRMPAYTHYRISGLEDISMFTTDDDKPLAEVFYNIYKKENGGPCISAKASAAEHAAYLKSVLENYDQERVHASDIKKLFSWYNLLQEKSMLKEKAQDSGEEASAEATSEKPKARKAGAAKEGDAKIAKPKKEAAPKAKATSGGAAKRASTPRKTGG
jgi:hypothetical protein